MLSTLPFLAFKQLAGPYSEYVTEGVEERAVQITGAALRLPQSVKRGQADATIRFRHSIRGQVALFEQLGKADSHFHSIGKDTTFGQSSQLWPVATLDAMATHGYLSASNIQHGIRQMGVSKKLRFEVFKRDKFTCQYCGKSAPDVVLHCDHIEPKSKGGKNSPLNLTTACEACNLGKSDRRLSDDSIVTKQRAQLDALQERREQLEMLIEWQRSLADLDGDAAAQVEAFWHELSGFGLSDTGRRNLKRSIRKYGVSKVMEAIRIGVDSYLAYDDDGDVTQESAEIALKKIPGICTISEAEKSQPYLKDLFYVRAIIRNRLNYIIPHEAKAWLETAFSWGAGVERLKSIACSASSWRNWVDRMIEYIKELKHDAGGDDE